MRCASVVASCITAGDEGIYRISCRSPALGTLQMVLIEFGSVLCALKGGSILPQHCMHAVSSARCC